jgi:hypothetical protein
MLGGMPRVGILPMLLLGLWMGCDGDAVLRRIGFRTIREVPVERAVAWLHAGRALLVQRRDPEEDLPPLESAQPLAPDAPIPESLEAAPGWLLVVASEPDEALRLAARLSRTGIPRVGVVTGDLTPLRELRTASRRKGNALQPFDGRRHRRP